MQKKIFDEKPKVLNNEFEYSNKLDGYKKKQARIDEKKRTNKSAGKILLTLLS